MECRASCRRSYNRRCMRASTFDEEAFFRSIAASGIRALLIGRRALVLLGLPVLTADYDFWIGVDDLPAFNAIADAFDLVPSRSPEEARRAGRYALENDERIDVLVARSISTLDGVVLELQDLWTRRQLIQVSPDVTVAIPAIDDLIRTKQVAARAKDLEDIRLLRILREQK